MRIQILAIGLLTISVSAVAQQRDGRIYSWVDEDGVTHYDDSIPAEYSELDREIVNEHGVTLQELEGRKTEEELAAEREAEELRLARELQLRADQALLATYLSVEEIEMHRDRRIELFQAQTRVTELYLRNLERELEKLERQASRYQPYSSDPEAEMIDQSLIDSINETRETIERHENNLARFQEDEETMIARFEGDIQRFRNLNGLE